MFNYNTVSCTRYGNTSRSLARGVHQKRFYLSSSDTARAAREDPTWSLHKRTVTAGVHQSVERKHSTRPPRVIKSYEV